MTFPHSIQAVIFDMDGLLLNTERPVRAAAMAAAERLGRPMTEDFYATLIGQPFQAVQARLAEHFTEPDLLNAFGAEFRAALAAARQELTLMPGAVELLDDLEMSGLPLAVCTSTAREWACRHLERVGILHRFRTVVGGDDVEQGKPRPDPYLKVARILGIDPAHCLVLEDSHNGVRAAHAAGMMAIMIPDLLPATAEIRALCHHVADDLHAVQALLSLAGQPRAAAFVRSAAG